MKCENAWGAWKPTCDGWWCQASMAANVLHVLSMKEEEGTVADVYSLHA
jgi:hypothetical protein